MFVWLQKLMYCFNIYTLSYKTKSIVFTLSIKVCYQLDSVILNTRSINHMSRPEAKLASIIKLTAGTEEALLCPAALSVSDFFLTFFFTPPLFFSIDLVPCLTSLYMSLGLLTSLEASSKSSTCWKLYVNKSRMDNSILVYLIHFFWYKSMSRSVFLFSLVFVKVPNAPPRYTSLLQLDINLKCKHNQ